MEYNSEGIIADLLVPRPDRDRIDRAIAAIRERDAEITRLSTPPSDEAVKCVCDCLTAIGWYTERKTVEGLAVALAAKDAEIAELKQAIHDARICPGD